MDEPTTAATSQSAQPERRTELWTYIGARMTRDHKLEHHWLDAEGVLRIFEKVRAPMVGAIYELRVTPKDSERTNVSVVPDPRWKREHADAEARRGWMAEHRANQIAYAAWRAGQKDQGELIGKMTLREIGLKYRRFPTTLRRAFLALVLERIMGGRGDE